MIRAGPWLDKRLGIGNLWSVFLPGIDSFLSGFTAVSWAKKAYKTITLVPIAYR
jgi:hypothetical protein